MIKYKFLVTFNYFTKEAQEILNDHLVDVKSIGRFRTEEEMAEIIDGYDALLADGDTITEKVIEKADHLKVISHLGVGYDNIDVNAATKKGVGVTFCPEAPSESVADFTWGLILACVRKIPQADNYVKEKKWDFNKFISVDVCGKTLGVLGAGRIGSRVIRRAKGFDMKVLYHQRHRNRLIEKTFDAKYVPINELLRKSDIISINIPSTNETRGILGKKELNMMKNEAFLVNTSRGAVVDENALYIALKTKKIAGAGLDVLTIEPPLKNNPLFSLENIVITPHIAAATNDALIRLNITIANDALAFLNGKKPQYILNPEVMETI